jgi:hypothetical protein
LNELQTCIATGAISQRFFTARAFSISLSQVQLCDANFSTYVLFATTCDWLVSPRQFHANYTPKTRSLHSHTAQTFIVAERKKGKNGKLSSKAMKIKNPEQKCSLDIISEFVSCGIKNLATQAKLACSISRHVREWNFYSERSGLSGV